MTRWPLFAVALTACVPDTPAPDQTPHDEWDDKLAARVVDYNAALRIAALRLTGELPTLDEIESVSTAADPKSAYEAQIHTYMQSPKFARQMFHYWQDALMIGGDADSDAAPAFAAKVTTDGRSYLELFTAAHGTCPTIDPDTFAVTAADCTNSVPTHAGILTNPGVMKHLFSNFAFRRVRWIQETFVCTHFPAEVALTGADVGGATPYTGAFPFSSIAGTDTGGRVNFHDTSAVICANCHSNLNHIAPLFGHFDNTGQYQTQIVVPTPLPMNPVAVRGDYLPAGEALRWRSDSSPIVDGDLPALGRSIAADSAVAECAIDRVWNWALGRTDIVDTATRVPTATIQSQIDAFVNDGFRLREAIYRVFTSDDFVRF